MLMINICLFIHYARVCKHKRFKVSFLSLKKKGKHLRNHLSTLVILSLVDCGCLQSKAHLTLEREMPVLFMSFQIKVEFCSMLNKAFTTVLLIYKSPAYTARRDTQLI